MKGLVLLLTVIASAVIAVPVPPAHAQGDTMVTGAGEGVFASGAELYGVPLDGLQFGSGVIIPGDGSATGEFKGTLRGSLLLAQPQNITVEGQASSGFVNADGRATFEGIGTVDLGNGQILTGVPFSVTATTQGLQLVIGDAALPEVTVTTGSIMIE
jgi:hypothetical protein